VHPLACQRCLKPFLLSWSRYPAGTRSASADLSQENWKTTAGISSGEKELDVLELLRTKSVVLPLHHDMKNVACLVRRRWRAIIRFAALAGLKGKPNDFLE
jgi:hypothetical protein